MTNPGNIGKKHEGLGSKDQPLTEARIEQLVEVTNRAIAIGVPAPLALTALEVHLLAGLKALGRAAGGSS